MKRINRISWTICLAVCFCSCTEWLKVTPRTESEREELFDTEYGLKDALTGCYIKLRQPSLYGKSLSMTTLEYMAQSWQVGTGSNSEYLSLYDYSSTNVQVELDAIYENFYNVVVQANDIINALVVDGKGSQIDSTLRQVILGEAYALRALCHFDLLRLYGPVPRHAEAATPTVLSYVTELTFAYIPKDTYGDYVDKIDLDFQRAAELLKQSDVILNMSLKQSDNAGVSDIFYAFRRYRLNYWAVEALRARFYLYTQNREKALECAREVIEAETQSGVKVVELAGKTDFETGKYALPGECLFCLSVDEMNKYTERMFRGDAPTVTADEDKVKALFSNSTTDLRLVNLWTTLVSETGNSYYVIKKYWAPETTEDNLGFNIVPVIRLSEMYLIAMECASLEKAEEYAENFKKYRDIQHVGYGGNEVARQEDVMNEFRKEFYAEGANFYLYKRLALTVVPWGFQEMTDGMYMPPVPTTDRE